MIFVRESHEIFRETSPVFFRIIGSNLPLTGILESRATVNHASIKVNIDWLSIITEPISVTLTYGQANVFFFAGGGVVTCMTHLLALLTAYHCYICLNDLISWPLYFYYEKTALKYVYPQK